MSAPTESDMLAAVAELAAQANAREWDGGIRIVLQGSMRAPITNGQVSLEAGWRVDVFYDSRARRPAFVLVNETPEGALRDLAAIIEEQRAPLGITKSRNV